ncbi:hypothetical protein [Brachybacterium kimchii]|uniref:Uncharacterized protein n=1 Tax=Brachybacterium kimchii TaxID=2942909 RepID=A0ABY4NAX4_9MICO|nr:hypothetical protein [Brachybacterium kimchii]UQN30578.1 hypothetical protein M4486_04495 [Brachybacterium kimchii]
MHILCRDVSAVSRTLGIHNADLASIRTTHGEVLLFLAVAGEPIEPLTVSTSSFRDAPNCDQIAVRDYDRHRGLPIVLEAAGIAMRADRIRLAGQPLSLMDMAPCLLRRLPATAPERMAAS